MLAKCGDFTFFSNFDSGNLFKVELVAKIDNIPNQKPFYEYNLWTTPDCYGTKYQNSNRSWFYFGVKDSPINCLVKLSIKNLNKQNKMYIDGMTPVYRILPNRIKWRRIKDKLDFFTERNNFVIQFNFKTTTNPKSVYYFAFTYPFSYFDSQKMLNTLDRQYMRPIGFLPGLHNQEDIYYYREILCYSLEKRRVDLITITSYHGINNKRESRLENLFPDSIPRPYGFNKKFIFISARVHPGETPSSFVFNGLLKFLLSDHTLAKILRRLYVFKLIPMLNPDGVARGHYRTDSRGVNLNRVYNNPDFFLHPSIYGAKAVILFHHNGYNESVLSDEYLAQTIVQKQKNRFTRKSKLTEKLKDVSENLVIETDEEAVYFQNQLSECINWAMDNRLIFNFNKSFINFRRMQNQLKLNMDRTNKQINTSNIINHESSSHSNKDIIAKNNTRFKIRVGEEESTKLFLYLDLHGHASKKGIVKKEQAKKAVEEFRF